ncbi:MAG TPA: tetratricopeptide repeat protein [Terriglobales bacterium]|nr:tetratricopeptide repeat protein [Terriglobales bacterium]
MKSSTFAVLLSFALCLFVGAIAGQAQAPAVPTPADAAMEMVKQGRQLNSQGKQDEALALYQQALKASPDLFEAHLGAGVALDLKGQYAEARYHLNRALEAAKPEQKNSAMRTLAMSYAFEGKAGEAAKYERPLYDEAVAKSDFPTAAEIANEQARLFIEAGDLDNAQKWYQMGHETALRKADLKPEERDLWDFRWENAQARIAARRGNRAEAGRHVAAAKAIMDKGTITRGGNTDQTRFWPYLTGYVAYHTGDYKTAIGELQKADQRDPFIMLLLAQSYEKTGDAAKAKELYQQIMTVNSHNPTNAFARPVARKKLGTS